MTPDPAPRRRPDKLPDWFPPGRRSWPISISPARPRRSSCTATPTISFGSAPARTRRYGVLAEFLAEQVFGRWSLVLHYDLGQRAARLRRTRRAARSRTWWRSPITKVGDLSALPKDPAAALRRARSLRPQQHHGGGGRSPEPRGDHRPGVVRLSGRRARPPQPAGLVRAGDDAQLGDEPAGQAAEHGVRAGRREAVRPERSPDRQSARRDDRGAAAERDRSATTFIETATGDAPMARTSPTSTRPGSRS